MRILSFIVLVSLVTVSTAAQVTEDKLTASDGASGDFFGRSVSLSGDRGLVGAYLDDDMGLSSGMRETLVQKATRSFTLIDQINA